jgi:hypothetical protein
MGAEPIAVVWLRANGWRPHYRERCPDLFRRAICGELCTGRPFLAADDDLCIDVAPAGQSREWFVWITHAGPPERFVHVRMMAHRFELEQLYEALTGRKFMVPEPRG